MVFYTLLLITIFLALLSVYALRRAFSLPLQQGWTYMLFALSITAFTYHYGLRIYASVFLKYIFASVAIVTISYCRTYKSNQVKTPTPSQKIFHLLFSIVFSTLCILYYTGTVSTQQKASLTFPFKHGNYYVLQGGKGLPTNLFHYSYRGAVFAMDIVKLNKWGNRADKIYSSSLTDYTTFGDTIYSPCNGVILETRDDNPDNLPTIRKRGPNNTNAILIDDGDHYIFLAHLQYHRVFVQTGMHVKAGQPLALAGNSGFTLEPHLHIQAHKKAEGIPWYRCPPLWMEFDHQSYLHFQVIHAD